MSNLSLRHLYKVYPNGVKAVNDFNMEIQDREFIVFVGPSGCGKSTTLRMIAGLEEITAGELYIGDTFSNHIEPKDRDIAMVFQNYALYPHMTVYENLAFGLNLRHVPQAEIHQKVLWAAKILKLEEYLERKPKALSGGQRQRVSLGRAILRTPKVFLLDEPLSNLDAKLRTEMRAEIAKLHQEIATTFIYVTHDQVEAMTMGTRIVVMSMGYVQQIDTPQNLYNYPQNKFVAGFIGTPQMNFFPVTLKRNGATVDIRFDGLDTVLTIPFEKLLKVRPEYLNGDKKVTLGLRCEHLSADEEVVAKSDNVVKVKISHFEELGNETLIYGDLNLNMHGLGDSETGVIVKQYGGTHTSKIGDVIDVAVNIDKAHFFDAVTEQTIAPRVPQDNVFDGRIEDGSVEILGQRIELPEAIIKLLDGKTYSSASVIVPTDAFTAGSMLSATVTDKEVINDVTVTHLKNGERTFFMLGANDYEIGAQVGLDIDFTKLSVFDADNNEILAPLPVYDTFVGSYFDRVNAKRSVQQLVHYYGEQRKAELAKADKQFRDELSTVKVNEDMVKAVKAEFAAQRLRIQEEMSYKLGTEGTSKDRRDKIKVQANQQIAEAKLACQNRVEELKAQMAAYSNLSGAEQQQRKQAEADITAKYNKAREAINAKYDKLIATAQDNVAALDGKLLPLEQGRADNATKLIGEEDVAYAKRREELTAQLEKAIVDAEAKVQSTVGEERDDAVVALKDAKRSKKDRLVELAAEHDRIVDDIVFDSKVFTTYINGCSFVSSLDINKKIVKGLGAQLFLSHYRFEVPHDAYKQGDGIELTVKEMVDYGNARYAKCDLHGEVVYVKTENNFNAGDKLSVVIDIDKSRIYENKFDIRLY